MRPNLFLIGIAISAIFVTSSCQKDEQVYSCDPEKDRWVKDNIEEISQMTRTQWLDMDISLAKPVYIAFSPEQKYNLWIEKINDMLKMEWTVKERSHIESIISFLKAHKEMFNNKANRNEKIYNQVEVFLYKWYIYGKDELGWSNKLMAGIIADPHQLKDKEGNLIISSIINTAPNAMTRSELDCNCNLGSIWYSDCVDVDCDYLSTGCGGFIFFSCDGRHEL